ncbi:hypothetical protein LI328DRAFT_166750 [Trichoderma asperelloides]|nr:hypothetical protein LI328DRAFT_166750 [Trichoderma asperelloides]
MSQRKGTDRKLPMPPAKVACLHCRAARTRCDGEQPCYGCKIRDRNCSYIPSKRGGSRKRRVQKKGHVTEDGLLPSPPTQLLTLESIEHLAIPGAGLKRPETIEEQSYTKDETLSLANLAGEHGARVYENEQELLALSAILALIPLPHEARCTSAAYRHVGSAAASEQLPIARDPFHPQAPVELESILALLLLSNYEHTERANLLKMTARASQALIIAKNMSLHRLGTETDNFSEAKRRVWWMTYFCAHLCSVVRQSAWLIFLDALRIGVASVKFTSSYNEQLNSHTDMSAVNEQMKLLDRWVLQVSNRAESYIPVSGAVELDPSYESTTAQVMRRLSRIRLSSTRIRLHRFQAFSDTPLFSENHCDLKTTNSFNNSANISSDTNITPYNMLQSPAFTYDQSTDICVASALTIARQLQRLPFPSASIGVISPRAMPTCTCCAMQASYVLLMQFYKLHATHTQPILSGDLPQDTERAVDELRHGLEDIISSMNNFATAFEAIAGMRDEIEIAFHIAFPYIATIPR